MANNSPIRRIMWLVIWASCLIAGYFVFSKYEWHIDQFTHTILETSATIIALFISILLLVSYATSKDRILLFFGIGFLGTAILDANHAIVTSVWISQEPVKTAGETVNWNWNSSRLFLSLLMFLSCWKKVASSSVIQSRRVQEKSVYLILGTLTFAIVALFAFFPVSNPYSDGFSVGRPIELPPAIFFFAALLIYLGRTEWQKDKFSFWLVLFLVSSLFYQLLYMPNSRELFDTMFTTAHLLKISSYLFVFIGLASNVYDMAKQAQYHSEEISRTNQALQKEIAEKNAISERMKLAAVSLEEKVRERTKDLEDSRIAAFNMMEDANEAKKSAERSREELDEQAKKLSRSNKELEQFAYVASHDLQEPLRTVGSFVQLLAQRYQGKLEKQADEYIQFIVEGVSRMRQLINDLLMFSRVETKGGEFAPTDCELVMGEVLSNLKASIDASNAIITKDQLPMLVADKVQLSQVFQNLIGNALKFKGEKTPQIHIGALKEGNYWAFTVQDNGIGFDLEFSEKIFIIFQRLHTRSEYQGTGIGLSLCKKIVERHGGKITVDSAPGRGSTFKFTIPDNMGEQNEYSSFEQANRNTVGRR